MMDPWGERFSNSSKLKKVWVTAPTSGDTGNIRLSALDVNASTFFVSESVSVLFPVSPEHEVVIEAAQRLTENFPILAGRYCADGRFVNILCNNAGFPLTIGAWPEGCVEMFPGAMTFKGWRAKLPSRLPAPCFLDELDSFGAVFEQQPLFKMRLTTLGADGGAVLAMTVTHGVCDAAHLALLMRDLAKACRGEPLEPLPQGLSRRLLTAEGLGEAVPFLKPVLDSVAASIAQDAEEDTELNFKEAWQDTFGMGDDHIPNLPSGDTTEHFSLASIMLEIPRTDLAALQEVFGKVGSMKLSKNDILIGIYWSMRCIAAGTPLPGQPGSEADFGITSVDLAYNSFPGIFDGYFGNTITGFMVRLPPPGCEGSNSEPAALDREGLLTAVKIAAAANRQALTGFRSGQELKSILKKLMAPNRMKKEKEGFEAMAAAGLRLRCFLSNIAYFGTKDAAEGMDCGTGAPTMFFGSIDRATRVGLVSGNGDMSRVFLQAFVPDDLPEQLEGVAFLESLIPNARIHMQ